MTWNFKLLEITGHVVGFVLPAFAMVLIGLGPFVAPTGWPFTEIGGSVAFWFVWFWCSTVVYFGTYVAWHLGVRRSRRRELAWFDEEGAKLQAMAEQIWQGEFARVQTEIDAYHEKRTAECEAACDRAVNDIAGRVVAEAKEHGIDIEARAVVHKLSKPN